MTVAALYVDPNGVYADVPDVDAWDEARDARTYAGPHPVVAHPPCARWCRIAGFVESRFGYKRGDDGGCFEAALTAVRTYGGVLEHPAYSAAWAAFGLPRPIWRGGWTLDLDGGASCYIEQGRYGLPTKKATWLYAYGVELPELRWGFTPDSGSTGEGRPEHGGLDAWRDSWVGGWQIRPGQKRPGVRINGKSSATSLQFRDALISMARTAEARPKFVVANSGPGADA